MVEKYINLRPICGFCKAEVKELPEMTEHGITLHCCRECGAVLGITKEEATF